MDEPHILHTLGHGRRDLAGFLAVVRSIEVATVVDVRANPASRRHPHFARRAIEDALLEIGVGYVFEGRDLGGHRSPARDSRHSALAASGMRGYADHMGTEAFLGGLRRLVLRARRERAAVLCAEQFPGDCHRSLLADRLLLEGIRVVHAIDPGLLEEHRMHRKARVVDGGLVYDGGLGRQLRFDF